MMRRSIIQAALVLLLTLSMSLISEGEKNDAKQIDLTKQSAEIQPSLIENSVFRVPRDARRKLRTRRKGNNQNQKHPIKGEKKMQKINKKSGQIKKKARQNKMNRTKLKKKEKKNKGKTTKNKKKSTKTEKKTKRKKSKQNSQHNKKESGQKKKSQQKKKKLRKKWKNSGQPKTKKDKLTKWMSKQDCDEKKLCKKIKNFITYTNQLRKVKRINRNCETMGKKAKKSASEFEATVKALEEALDSVTSVRIYGSQYIKLDNLLRSLGNARWRRAVDSTDDVRTIKDKLQNCSISAKSICTTSSVEPCQESTLNDDCKKELQGWIDKFGPSNRSCLQASDNCCACITALPDVRQECLDFDNKQKLVVSSKKKCANATIEGSFGYCRHLQRQAAVKGPEQAKKNYCKPSGDLTTQKIPSGGKTFAMNSATTAKAAVPPAEVTANTNPMSTAARPPVCTPQCEGVNKQGIKINGGTDATGPVPWIAHIPSLKCGGSVIANNWIVTAAHCFYNSDDGQQSIDNNNIDQHPIIVGEHMKELKPEELIIYPQFKYGNPKHLNDVALVKVPAIEDRLCLPTINNYDGENARVYGWGSGDKLQALDVIIQSDDAARQAYQNTISPLTNSQLRVMVFAGGEKDKDACDGDDGGPLTVGNQLVGIVSWGLGCGVQGLPRAYTEVSFFKDWIIEKTNICPN